jgi:heterodisulfide reductase subunit B
VTRYALFLGCTIPARQPAYELSARTAMRQLDIDLEEIDMATCCAPPPIESIDLKTSVAIGAYNLCLAEEMGMDVVTLCNGCFQSLAKTKATLEANPSLRSDVNRILAQVGKEYRGTIEAKHYLQVLANDLGVDAIRDAVAAPQRLRVASFYGCHILRPSSLLKFDDAEQPRILDDLVEATGAQSIVYRNKMKCCGGLLRGYEDEIALEMAREKLSNVTTAQADCIVTVCPFCFVALDLGQRQVQSKFDEAVNVPVFHYPELLAMALGTDPKALALNTHRINVDSALQKLGF